MAARLTLLGRRARLCPPRGSRFRRAPRRPAPRDRTRPFRHRRACAGGARRLHRRALRRLCAARATPMCSSPISRRRFSTNTSSRHAGGWNQSEPKHEPVAAAAASAAAAPVARAAEPGRSAARQGIRFSFRRLDPAGQHHECRAAAAEGGGRRARRANPGRGPAPCRRRRSGRRRKENKRPRCRSVRMGLSRSRAR